MFADVFGVAAEHCVGVNVEGEVFEVDAVLFQGGDALVEGVGDVDGVGGLGGAADADHALHRSTVPALRP